MKKTLLILSSILLSLLSVNGCGGKAPEETHMPEENAEVTETAEQTDGETLFQTEETETQSVPEKTTVKVDNLGIKRTAADSAISKEPGDFPHLGYYGWPSVAVDENDVTYVVVSKRLLHIDPYGKVMLYRSRDKGKTWDEGKCLIDTILDDRDAGILYLGNGKLLVTTFSHDTSLYINNEDRMYTHWQEKVGEAEKQKVLDAWASASETEKTGVSSYIISNDYGETWSDIKLSPVSAPHGPSLMNDGTVMYVGVPKSPKLATGETLEYGIYCYVSTDGGESFVRRSQIDVDRDLGPCEPYALQLEDGTIVATIRTESFSTLIAKSYDNGYTWTTPKKVTYGAPAHLLQTPDGMLIMSYSKRKDNTGQFIRFSGDGGESWADEICISSPGRVGDVDLGYPATARYSDGNFITVYYQRTDQDVKPALMRTLWKLTNK